MPIETKPQEAASPSLLAPALRLDKVSVRLGDRLALREIDCEVAAGSFVGLIGPNGSGKSTLIRAVLGVLPLASGSLAVEGQAVEASRDAFAYLPQRQQLEIDLPLRAWDVVMMGRLRHSGWLRPHGRNDREVAGWALEQVGLSDRRHSSIGEMSYGQQQRVLFARALAQEGRILLLDEPMNGVDTKTQDLFVDLLGRLHNEGKTIVMATHDLNQAACICDSLCVLNQRLIAYGPVQSTLTNEVLQAAYGAHIHFVDAAGAGHAQVLEDVHHHATDEALHRARLH
jgi:manganese/iron transport system ATP-binding protein